MLLDGIGTDIAGLVELTERLLQVGSNLSSRHGWQTPSEASLGWLFALPGLDDGDEDAARQQSCEHGPVRMSCNDVNAS